MALFDTVYVELEVLTAFPFGCHACGRVPGPEAEWQTKSLHAGMDSYVLPQDEEIAQSERDAERGGFYALWRKKPGEGCFLPEAFLPENRRQRFMGELPHQWVELYVRCARGEHVERHGPHLTPRAAREGP